MGSDVPEKKCRFTRKPCAEEGRKDSTPCEWEVEKPEPVEDWELQHLVIEE